MVNYFNFLIIFGKTATSILELEQKPKILELAFEKRDTRQLCENEAKAKRELGQKLSEILKRRLADLRAAPNASDLVVGRPKVFTGSKGQYIVLDLDEDFHIAFAANHHDVPVLASGDVDWKKVSRVKILEIGKKA